MAVKINKLEIENVKRVHAVKMEPAENGLTIIGGDNNQGKTSVLDAIAWALGGNGFRPSEAKNNDSVIPPYLHVVLSNGIVVERKGKNSDLKVTDPSGKLAGQNLLDSFVSKLALDLPKFMWASDSEKAKTLLNILGIGPQLEELNRKEQEIYNERTAVGRIADQKEKYAKEQPYYPDAPKDLVSAADLIRQQQDILARNGENYRKRELLKEITYEKHRIFDEIQRLDQQIEDLQKRREERRTAYERVTADEEIAMKTAVQLQDESTEELEVNIAQIDETNRKVRANMDKDKAEDDARQYTEQYESLTAELNEVRAQKKALLDHADLPLRGLSVEDGKLVFNGQQWDNMSGSDQLKVATAIVRKLNPQCGFVLLDKLEQMDLHTLHDFGLWLEQEGLQVIATRVSTGEECSIIISDGFGEIKQAPETAPAKSWKKGEF